GALDPPHRRGHPAERAGDAGVGGGAQALHSAGGRNLVDARTTRSRPRGGLHGFAIADPLDHRAYRRRDPVLWLEATARYGPVSGKVAAHLQDGDEGPHRGRQGPGDASGRAGWFAVRSPAGGAARDDSADAANIWGAATGAR